MTSYAGIPFLFLFLPVVIILYSVVKKSARPWVLLLAGYGFFWSISGGLLIYLVATTFLMHQFGLWLDKLIEERKKVLKTIDKQDKEEKKRVKAEYQKKQRGIVTLFVLIVLSVIIVIKYSGFFTENINAVLSFAHANFQLEIPKYAQPIGISFYTFMAISYVVDVHREVIKADDNLLRVSVFMSFFPQMMEGPFSRYGDVAYQIYECKNIDYKNLTFGIQRIGYGLFKKMVLADRLNPLVELVFFDYESNNGGMILVGMICYTLELYAEFSGTMDIVIGTAEIFGVKLPENFKQPFFAKTISEFWTRWHITLGTWFKDYIFYPVSMSKPMKNLTTSARKKIGNHYGPLVAGSIALFLVWISNGLWHGAGWRYICFGMYHFVLIVTGNMLEPVMKKFYEKTKIKQGNTVLNVLRVIRTFALVNIGELIFRSEGMSCAIKMLKTMFTHLKFDFEENFTLATYGIDKWDIIVLVIGYIVVLIISILKEKGYEIRVEVAKKNICIRWICYYILILIIVIFGAYGMGYTPVDPIYAGF